MSGGLGPGIPAAGTIGAMMAVVVFVMAGVVFMLGLMVGRVTEYAKEVATCERFEERSFVWVPLFGGLGEMQKRKVCVEWRVRR